LAEQAAGTYQSAEEEILDKVLFQVYYRQLGMVALHFGTEKIYQAAVNLSNGPRRGKVSWVNEGRIFQWDDILVSPGLPDTPKISAWFVGSAIRQKNTACIRKGWWTLYLPESVSRVFTTFRFPFQS